jgi:hypothetical protein
MTTFTSDKLFGLVERVHRRMKGGVLHVTSPTILYLEFVNLQVLTIFSYNRYRYMNNFITSCYIENYIYGLFKKNSSTSDYIEYNDT